MRKWERDSELQGGKNHILYCWQHGSTKSAPEKPQAKMTPFTRNRKLSSSEDFLMALSDQIIPSHCSIKQIR